MKLLFKYTITLRILSCRIPESDSYKILESKSYCCGISITSKLRVQDLKPVSLRGTLYRWRNWAHWHWSFAQCSTVKGRARAESGFPASRSAMSLCQWVSNWVPQVTNIPRKYCEGSALRVEIRRGCQRAQVPFNQKQFYFYVIYTKT